MSQRNEFLETVLGAFSILVINILVFILLVIFLANSHYFSNTSTAGLSFIFGISIYQFIYVIPAILWLKRRQRWAWMKGVIIGAAITVLLTGPCFVLYAPLG